MESTKHKETIKTEIKRLQDMLDALEFVELKIGPEIKGRSYAYFLVKRTQPVDRNRPENVYYLKGFSSEKIAKTYASKLQANEDSIYNPNYPKITYTVESTFIYDY